MDDQDTRGGTATTRQRHSTRRSGLILAASVVAALTAAACQSAPPPATPPPTTVATTTSSTTTSAPAPSTSVPAPDDLLVALEVHVEGWTYGTAAQLEQHLDELETLATAAEEHGAVLSFELGRPFAVALDDAGRADWVSSMRDRGHDVQMHADVGGSGTPSLGTLTTQLLAQLGDLAAIGVEPDVVTGVCSKGPWLEAVAAAGIPMVAGMVEYCLHSLDPTNDPVEFDRAACRTPATCHDSLGTVLDVDVPWYAADSSEFLTPVDAATPGAVFLIPGGEGPVCGSEGSSGTACTWDDGDPAGYAAKLADAIAARSTTSTSVFTSAWSVGTPVDPAFADQVFGELESVMAGGGARWVRISDIGDLAT